MMIELIESGIYSTKNLMTALHLCKDTIVRWKKRPEVQLAHRKAILKFSKKRKDPEGSLKELGIEAARVEEKSHIEVTIRGYED